MIRSNDELYDSVQNLMSLLERAGEERWRVSLEDGLYISNIAGEVLGETRIRLRALRKSAVAARLELNRQIDEALQYLDLALRCDD